MSDFDDLRPLVAAAWLGHAAGESDAMAGLLALALVAVAVQWVVASVRGFAQRRREDSP